MRYTLHVLLLPLLILLVTVGLTSCGHDSAEVPHPAHAVYHWRQELTLGQGERAFISEQQIGKVYLHLFDVVREHGELRPRATLTVTDTLPSGVEVIPVVFMANDVLRDTTGLAALPQLITRRVDAFMQQNGLSGPDELQIDFDWTRRNQVRYFDLLRQMSQCTHRQLSATIRLHQLGMEAPPVSYGALMVYNLGRIQDPDEPNSILSTELLQPYLRYLKGYSLPLCTALPLYSWDLLYHDNKFQCIVRGIDVTDTTRFMPIDDTHYRSIRYQPVPPGGVSLRGDGRIFPGDVIRHEFVRPEVLHQVRQQIYDIRPSACSQVILYHLDDKQLKQYTTHDIKTLYTGH